MTAGKILQLFKLKYQNLPNFQTTDEPTRVLEGVK